MSSIVLRTEIPGPRSRALTARKDRVVARAKSLWTPVWVDHAEGALLTDVDGNTFIDFAGGIGCLNVGHSHPRVTAAVARGGAALPAHRLHDRARTRATSSSPSACCRACRSPARRARPSSTRAPRRWRTRSRSRAPPPGRAGRDRLRGRLPRPHADGDVADLQDAALQARHGPVRARGLPRRLPRRLPPRARRGRARADRPAPRAASRASTRPTVAAIIIEPVQGEGGFVPASPAYLHGPARSSATSTASSSSPTRCRAASAAPGRLFAMEHMGVEPDLVCVAKSIAGGMPLSGVLGRAAIMDAPGRLADRRHLRRQPRGLRRGPGRAGRDRRRGAAGARHGDRRAHARALPGAAGADAGDRRRARPRAHARRRVRARRRGLAPAPRAGHAGGRGGAARAA